MIAYICNQNFSARQYINNFFLMVEHKTCFVFSTEVDNPNLADI